MLGGSSERPSEVRIVGIAANVTIISEIQKLKRILADQGIEVEVLRRRRKLNEDEREKYLHRNPDNSTENAML